MAKKLSINRLKRILVEPGYITQAQFDSVQKEAKEKGETVEEVLSEKELIEDKHFGKLVAEELGYNFINLREEAISEEIVKIVPELVAKNQQVIVFDRTKEELKVAMADPNNFEMLEWLKRKTGEKVIPYYATPKDIKESLKYYRKEIKETFEEIIQTVVGRVQKEKIRAEDIPIIKVVDTLIEYAYENRASDIHIEPLKEETQVRFRIDGVLHNVLTLPKNIHNLIVTRLKVLAKLRTDEHFAAQDGKFTAKFEKERFDIRISIVPVTEGENIVMRLLSARARQFTLEGLGLSDRDLKKVKNAIKKPFGMILATGPTGCGKTTTLYIILKKINKPEINICTIEDPVEYDIEGVSQIQVNPRTNLTFAKGLRSVVRQDPDIMMIGEIRDSETVDIAINAAMTGHLILSTMHANTAVTNLPRLIDMGAEPFLVASSINIIIAQRLVRKICSRCRESYEIAVEELKPKLPIRLLERLTKGKKKIRLFQGKGCKACNQVGYKGRTGIFEVLEIKDNIKELVMQKADTGRIQAQAIKNGMTTMLEDGIDKALAGLTTIEEVIRVTHEA